MTEYELHVILASNRELIAQTWEFFVTVHLAIMGIFYVASRVPKKARFIFIFPYMGFLYLNFRAQIDNYTYAAKILNYLQDVVTTNSDSSTQTLTAAFKAGWILPALPIIYSIALIFGITAIVFAGSNKVQDK